MSGEPVSAFAVYQKISLNKKRDKVRKHKRLQQKPKQPIVALPERERKPKKQPRRQISVEKIPKLVEVPTVEQPPARDDPTTNAGQLFKWLISPLSPKAFFRDFWEQETLHIERTDRSYYSHIFSSKALDQILRNHPLYYTRNVDVVSYENGVKEVHNAEGRAAASALWDYYSNGCSIRVLNPQTYHQKVHLLLATLQEYFGSMVGANVYLTPPESQGFAPHYDDIEAFVVQLEGRKHWKLYKPQGSDVLARFSSPNFKREDLGTPCRTVTLEAGEVLYFPRGTIHEGYTTDAHSLHITISMYQQTCYADLLERILPQALQKAARADVRFRKGLPLHYLKDQGEVTDTVKDLMYLLVQYMDVDQGVDQMGRKLMYDSMPPVLSKGEVLRSSKGDGPHMNNGEITNRVELSPDTRVRLLRYYCLRLVQEDDDIPPKLYYNTENANVYHGEDEQWLELKPEMVAAIKTLQSIYPNYIEIDKLPMEDSIEKMQLIADLWEHGIVITEQPLDVLDE